MFLCLSCVHNNYGRLPKTIGWMKDLLEGSAPTYNDMYYIFSDVLLFFRSQLQGGEAGKHCDCA